MIYWCPLSCFVNLDPLFKQKHFRDDLNAPVWTSWMFGIETWYSHCSINSVKIMDFPLAVKMVVLFLATKPLRTLITEFIIVLTSVLSFQSALCYSWADYLGGELPVFLLLCFPLLPARWLFPCLLAFSPVGEQQKEVLLKCQSISFITC